MNFITNLKRAGKSWYCLIFSLAFLGSSICKTEAAIPPPSIQRDFLGIDMPNVGIKWPYRQGALWLGLQSGIGFIDYPEFGTRKGLMPLQLNADYSFDDHWAVGGYFGYFNSSYNFIFGNQNLEGKFTGMTGGLRLTLHWSDVFNDMFREVLNIISWDLYTTAFGGIYNRKWDVDDRARSGPEFLEGSKAQYGVVMGLRWHPAPKFGVFAEGGLGSIGYFGFGLNAKLMK
jgi:hypothetical protein